MPSIFSRFSCKAEKCAIIHCAVAGHLTVVLSVLTFILTATEWVQKIYT